MTRSCCIRMLVVACLVFAHGLQDARGEWQVRDLTDETTGPGVQPAVDGPWIAWRGFWDQWVYDADRGISRAVTSGQQTSRPHAAGARDAFFGTSGLFVWDFPTQSLLSLPRIPASSIPIDFDGETLVSTGDDGGGDYEVYAYRISTGEVLPLTRDDVDQLYPAVGGRHVVWVSAGSTPGSSSLWLHDLVTGATSLLAEVPGEISATQIAGGTVAWLEIDHGNIDVYVHDLATRVTQRLSHDDHWKSGPIVRGGRAAWLAYLPGVEFFGYWTFEVHVQDLSTGDRKVVGPFTGPVIDGVRSIDFDGETVVFTGAEGALPLPCDPVEGCLSRVAQRRLEFEQLLGVWAYDLAAQRVEEVAPLGPYDDAEPRISGPRIVWSAQGRPTGDGVLLATRDRDGDGAADPVDLCPAIADPIQSDADSDGVGDACDNCPATPNADQLDGDRDGRGDACSCTPEEVPVLTLLLPRWVRSGGLVLVFGRALDEDVQLSFGGTLAPLAIAAESFALAFVPALPPGRVTVGAVTAAGCTSPGALPLKILPGRRRR